MSKLVELTFSEYKCVKILFKRKTNFVPRINDIIVNRIDEKIYKWRVKDVIINYYEDKYNNQYEKINIIIKKLMG